MRARRATKAPVCLHRDDLFLYDHVVEAGTMFGLRVERQQPVDRSTLWGMCFRSAIRRAPPSHSRPLSWRRSCLQVGRTGAVGKELLWAIRSLLGRSGEPICRAAISRTLIESIQTVLYGFGDDAIVHPGHGPDTTIGRERKSNPFLVGTSA